MVVVVLTDFFAMKIAHNTSSRSAQKIFDKLDACAEFAFLAERLSNV